jgi:hypothetical protein
MDDDHIKGFQKKNPPIYQFQLLITGIKFKIDINNDKLFLKIN